MKPIIKKYSSPGELAENLAETIVSMVMDAAAWKKTFTVALSGGSTPEMLFSVIGNSYAGSVPWDIVHFFWGDERCVAPEDKESNFGMTNRTLFEKISIPPANIHRIYGEDDSVYEAARYSVEITEFTRSGNALPVFDLILLGLGEDGHTASVFPQNIQILDSNKVCEVAVHPVSNQKRITITGRVINNADNIVFLVTGKNKAKIVAEILNNSTDALNYPATHIVPVNGTLSWYLDNDASSLL